MSSRRRATAALTVALLPLGLVACTAEAPDPPPEPVPTTLSARPTPKPQPKARIEATAPRVITGGGISAGAPDKVWEQALDLVRDWLLNPAYMQRHAIRERDELAGLGRLMTPEARKRWNRTTRRVIEGHLDPDPTWLDRRAAAEGKVHQLVVWNLKLDASRAWDNPMLGPVQVSEGSVMGADGRLRTILRIRTTYRFVGNGQYHRVPVDSVLGLIWEQHGDAWLLDDWWRTVGYGKEREVDRRRDPAPSTGSSTTPTPDRPTRSPGGPQVDPTLVPD